MEYRSIWCFVVSPTWSCCPGISKIDKNFFFVGCSILSAVLCVKKIMGTRCRGLNKMIDFSLMTGVYLLHFAGCIAA